LPPLFPFNRATFFGFPWLRSQSSTLPLLVLHARILPSEESASDTTELPRSLRMCSALGCLSCGFQSNTVRSSWAEAGVLPSKEKAGANTPAPVGGMTASVLGCSMSHRQMLPPRLPEASVPFGAKPTDDTFFPCPVSTALSSRLAAFQSRTLLSLPQLA